MKARYGGWTLVEVLTSMAIVFVLTGTVGHVGAGQIRRARELAARQEVAVLEIALEAYAIDCGDYPTEAQGLEALWRAPVLHPVPARWNGPYLDREITGTPWGTEYRYHRPGEENRPWRIDYETP